MLSLNRKSQHDVTKKKRLKDAKPKANSRGLLSPWKQKERIETASVKTRNGNVSEDLKVLRYQTPRLPDGLDYEGFTPSTGLKTRGYLTSRLSDG